MIQKLIIAINKKCYLHIFNIANRHRLIIGLTDTRKIIKLQKIIASFPAIGVLVCLTDIKSDLTNFSMAATNRNKLQQYLINISISN
ncbi:MAG: DUF853 family protein [Candidatus Schmidhempelia sp.]|nr:DUF853 family protein [Candidatus Schmidhempelia sp.]